MPVLAGFFQRSRGPCPVCGAPQGACVAPATDQSANKPLAHVSREQVWEGDRLKYGVGTPVPLYEALRQGLVEVKDLSEEQRVSLREHVDRDPAAREAMLELRERRKKGKKRPDADKMVRGDEVTTK